MNGNPRIEQAKAALKAADCLLIGGGAGLSAAAGLEYAGERFTGRFADFIERYGFRDMYTAGFYPFGTEEERWAYWARHIAVNRYEPPALPLYRRLYDLVKDRDYFVITTNVDAQFAKAGFDEERLFAVQGDYGQCQCANGCHDALYENETMVKAMLAHTRDCRIPSGCVPRCPVCGGRMAVHLRCDRYFVEDAGWHTAHARYQAFLRRAESRRTLLLELGVGYNTPGIIRYPFEQMTARNPLAVLIRMNRDDPDGVEENRGKTIVFPEDMNEVMAAL